MCVNSTVKRAGSTGSDTNHDCSRLGQERKCNFRNRLEGFSAPGEEITSGFGVQPVKDMEDLVLMGQKHRVCPFYFTRSLVEDAELILVPYNYLFDKDSRTSTLADVPWKKTVVISTKHTTWSHLPVNQHRLIRQTWILPDALQRFNVLSISCRHFPRKKPSDCVQRISPSSRRFFSNLKISL